MGITHCVPMSPVSDVIGIKAKMKYACPLPDKLVNKGDVSINE